MGPLLPGIVGLYYSVNGCRGDVISESDNQNPGINLHDAVIGESFPHALIQMSALKGWDTGNQLVVEQRGIVRSRKF
jgi:hypothetical protein